MPPERPSRESIQAALLSFITGRSPGAGLPDLASPAPASLDPASLILGDARASAAARLEVYAFMYRARVVEALESQFPRLAKHLGVEDFAALSIAYVEDEPSTSPSLRPIGQRLAAWLAVRCPQAPALAGLARLEWARTDVFDQADDPVLTMDELGAWPADRFAELPLALIGAHRIVTVPAGTAAFWDAALAGTTDDTAAGSGQTARPESLLVWRQGTAVYHRVIDDDERAALELLVAGARFGVVCDGLLATRGETGAAEQAFAWLSTWATDGLLVSRAAA